MDARTLMAPTLAAIVAAWRAALRRASHTLERAQARADPAEERMHQERIAQLRVRQHLPYY